MSTIAWLHLSDLHFRSTEWNPLDTDIVRRTFLEDAAACIEVEDLRPDFIVVTGDIAFSGQKVEYELAQQFFDNLLQTTGLTRDRLFLVPGNHDVDRGAISTLAAGATVILNNRQAVNRFLASAADRALVLQRFHGYRDFVNHYFGPHLTFDNEHYFYVKHIQVAGLRIAILGLNSAWLAASDEDRYRLLLGERQVRSALDAAADADLRLAVMHHPFDWLQEFDRNDAEPLLCDGCDFVLHGHMHQTGLLQAHTPDAEAAMIIAAGACYETRHYPNSYNFVQLDFSSGRGHIYLRRYSDERGSFWTKDTIGYLNAPDGIHTFALPDRLSAQPVSLRPVPLDKEQRPTEVRIFLSYAREDREKVQEIYQRLAAAGVRPWMDTQDILPGEKWEMSIRKAVRDSDFFLVFLSRNSSDRRGFVQKELRAALNVWEEMLESDLYLIPVRLEECEVPETLAAFQGVDLFEENAWARLLGAIQAGMERRGTKTRIGVEPVPPTERVPKEGVPDGLILQATLRGHQNVITRIAWSPDGRVLATPSLDETVRLWDVATGKTIQTLRGHSSGVFSLAWSPQGDKIASGCDQGTIRIWDVRSGAQQNLLSGHKRRIECLAWSPDGTFLASASADATVRIWSMVTFQPTLILKDHRNWVNGVAWSPDGNFLLTGAEDNTARVWDSQTGKPLWVLRGHTNWISDVAWAPDGKLVASASNDLTIRLWDPAKGTPVRILEGHTDFVRSISFSPDGRFLASKSHDQTVRLWRCDTWEPIAVLSEPMRTSIQPTPSVAFHPRAPILATVGENDLAVHIWRLDISTLLGTPTAPAVEYVNAKVVLLGEGSVGKSGLGIRIAEKRFRPTPPTHAAQFWRVPVKDAPGLPSNVGAEITLWDLAGQADYYLIHVLFLDGTNAALLLFDGSDPSASFRGVHYWANVLKRKAPPDALKLLVAARCDICPVTVDSHEITRVLGRHDLDGYVCTSALTGEGVDQLMQRLVNGIHWDRLPRTTTPRLFQAIRELLLERKMLGATLVNMRGIWNEIRRRYPDQEAAQDEVSTVVDSLQSQGLVYRLTPAPTEDWVLLRHELINQYAASIIQAARSHPQGIGAVPEHEVAQARLLFTGFERLEWQEERIVLESVVELLIKNDLCFREVGMLVFPSQINVTRPDPVTQHPRTEITYRFAGSLETIYASLVVRLSHTRYFQRRDQWKYAAEFSRNGHVLGFAMRRIEEGMGELEIYFYPGVTDFDRVLFTRFITDHLRARDVDLEEHIRIYCPKCGKEVDNRKAIAARVEAGTLDIPCQYCPDDTKVMIPLSIEELYHQDRSYAEKQQELSETAKEKTMRDIEEFKTAQRQYTGEVGDLIHILHLSDIHLGTQEDAHKYLMQLETDLRRELEVNHLEYLVLSGDAADKSTPEEYQAAFELVDGLANRFGLEPERVIIVPGNHDLNWDLSKQAYSFVFKEALPDPLLEGKYILAGDVGVLVRDDDSYRQRFAHFSEHFYKRIYGRAYPLDYVDQAFLWFRPDDCIVFLALNSCWEIDYHFHKRAGIHMEALARALDQLQGHEYDNWLRIAVWHYPVTGKEMMNDEFLQLLAVNKFQVCMHGHVHETKKGFYSYDTDRDIHIVGAGTFGAPAKDQVPGIPLQYNLLDLDRGAHMITVHTRKKDKPDGAWYADARWGKRGKKPKPSYTIELKDWTFS